MRQAENRSHKAIIQPKASLVSIENANAVEKILYGKSFFTRNEQFDGNRDHREATPTMKKVHLGKMPEEGVSHNPEIRKQVLFRKGDLPHLTSFSRSRLLPGQISRSHRHADMFEVFFVDSGVGVMRINGRHESLEAGVCIAVEPGEEHEITNTGSADLVLLYFGIEE